MEINKIINGNNITFEIIGRLDTTTAPSLEEELKTLPSYDEVSFDFKSLEYVSSAGLRVILKTYKEKGDKFSLFNVSEDIKELFDMTGFSDFLNIKNI